MRQIFAHRGKMEGLDAPENSLESLHACLEAGFSIETDLRLSPDGRILIVHDAPTSADMRMDLTLERLLADCGASLTGGREIALHMKEPGNPALIKQTCETLAHHNLFAQTFLFDLFLPTLPDIKAAFPAARLGVSVGEERFAPTIYLAEDLNAHLPLIDVIWADEWRSHLYDESFFRHWQSLNKTVQVISPELHAREAHLLAATPERCWEDLARMPFNGICTDFPKAYQRRYAE